MYIQEIIIDGFKSYAKRTVVSGFDPAFNAITGLNGTGKSNILDSICFVLGINNLSQVRVGNLQELVYKQGQAGVTKASVSIIFNNSDPATSPVGYESHKEITVTRVVRKLPSIHLFSFICTETWHSVGPGCHWWQEQVHYQWPHRPTKPSQQPLPQRAAECEQSALLNYARSHHQGTKHEADGDLVDDRRGRRNSHVRDQEAGCRKDHRKEAAQSGRNHQVH